MLSTRLFEKGADFIVGSEAYSVMGHQNWFYNHQMREMDHDLLWNHYASERMRFENRSIVPPAENVAVRAQNMMGYVNVPASTYGPASSSSSSEILSHRPANPEISHGFGLHTSSFGNSSRFPPNYAHVLPQHQPSFHRQHTVGDTNGRIDAQMDNRRVSYKRKSPAVSLISDQGSNNRYYCDGNTSLPISSDYSWPKNNSHSQYGPWGPVHRVPGHMGCNNVNAGEVFQRNVRSRYSHNSLLESNPAGGRLGNSLPQHFPPVANVFGQPNYPPPHSGNLSSGRTGACANGFASSDGRCYASSASFRNATTPFPMHHASAQTVSAGHNVFGQNTTGYDAMPGYRPTGFAATQEDNMRSGADAPYRHSRSLTTAGHRNERDRRARSSFWRYNPYSCEESTDRLRHWQSESIVIDQPTFFEPRNVFDEHWDMRLDIDSMSYEELLALEERIGNVSTGLSENTISSCLVETKYLSKQVTVGDDAEVKCAICLAEYEEGEHLGMLKCSHDFHFRCIKQWLVMKNVCPICKAPALADNCKEK
ncbi:E3 ubiquitin-protein ligase Arkadia protein [Dioscorea alata]|uniref:E3 ubiquitin-protein ligase Arkadia protein n=4 Tax=Dioscorea alata TaxID=55571 RepID=A0ACB7U982_DIOAL|nr:E3 ubiquitin-protein ligase Arkadia protein [Dioscorea alata]